MMLVRSILVALMLVFLAELCQAGEYCPRGSGAVTEDPGCGRCLCCKSAQTNDYLVRCDHRNLTEVPTALPGNVTELWLFGNQITQVNRMSRLGKLRKLKLSQCVESGMSDMAHWPNSVACQEKPVLVTENSFTEMPALEELELYIRGGTVPNFRKSLGKLRNLDLTCQGQILQESQKTLFAQKLVFLTSFGCGLRLHNDTMNGVNIVKIRDVYEPRDMSDTSEKPIVDLPYADVELRINAESVAECMEFSVSPEATRLRVLCKAQVFNVTAAMFRVFQGVGSLNLTLSAAREGYIMTTQITPPAGLQDLRIEMGFNDNKFYRGLLWTFRDVKLRSFQAIKRPEKSLQAAARFVATPNHDPFRLIPMNTTERQKTRELQTMEFIMLSDVTDVYIDIQVDIFLYITMKSVVVGDLYSLWNLRKFICIGCDITFFTAFDNYYLASLREVEFYSSDIKMTVNNLLSNYPLVERVIFSDMKMLITWLAMTKEQYSIKHFELRNNTVHINEDKHVNFTRLVNLEYLNLDYSFVNRFMCTQSVAALNQTYCLTVSHMRKLRVLSFAHNMMKFRGFVDDIFLGLDSVEELRMSGNRLGIMDPDIIPRLFLPVYTTIRHLDISANNLTTIPATISRMPRLEVLMINGNSIREISATMLPGSQYLSELGLGSNQLQFLDPSSLYSNQYLTRLNISNNNFRCDCQLRGLRDFLREKKSVIQILGRIQACYDTDHLRYVTTQVVSDYRLPWLACDSHAAEVQGIISCLSLVLVIGFVSAVVITVYRYRHDLKYMIFLRARKAGRGVEEIEEGQYEYDAFLSCAGPDEPLAAQIHERLESDQLCNLNIALHYRDFRGGPYISDQIADFIRNRSRKILFLISPSFLRRPWTMFELRQAEFRLFDERKNMLVLVFLEKIPEKDLPPSLRALVRQFTYLQYPGQDASHREMDVFYKRLKMSLSYNKRGTDTQDSGV